MRGSGLRRAPVEIDSSEMWAPIKGERDSKLIDFSLPFTHINQR